MRKIIALFDASVSTARLINEPAPLQQQNEAIRLSTDLSRYYHLNKVYLAKNLCKAMDAFTKKLADIMSDIGRARQIEPYTVANLGFPIELRDITASVNSQHKSLLDDAQKIIKGELPKIQQRIEKQMRKILGT